MLNFAFSSFCWFKLDPLAKILTLLRQKTITTSTHVNECSIGPTLLFECIFNVAFDRLVDIPLTFSICPGPLAFFLYQV